MRGISKFHFLNLFGFGFISFVFSVVLSCSVEVTITEGNQSSPSPSNEVQIIPLTPGQMPDSKAIFKIYDVVKKFIFSNQGPTRPSIISEDYLVFNSYHFEIGRGGYFPSTSSTSEAQLLMTRSLANASVVFSDESAKQMSLNLASSLMSYFFQNVTPNDLYYYPFWGPHWLVNANGSFYSLGPISPNWPNSANDMGAIAIPITFTNSIGNIPTPYDSNKLFQVYKIYSNDAVLKDDTVFSEVISGNEYLIKSFTFLNDNNAVEKVYPNLYTAPSLGSSAGEIELEENNFNGTLKVSFSLKQNTDLYLINKNQPFEAWPMLRPLRSGANPYSYEFNIAGDSYPWAYWTFDSLSKMTQLDMWTTYKYAIFTTFMASNDLNIANKFMMKRKMGSSDPIDGVSGLQIIDNRGSNVIRDPSSGIVNATIPKNTTGTFIYQNYYTKWQTNNPPGSEQDSEIAIEINGSISNKVLEFNLTSDINKTPNSNNTYHLPILTTNIASSLKMYKLKDFYLINDSKLFWDLKSIPYTGKGGVDASSACNLGLYPDFEDSRIPAYQCQLNKGTSYAFLGLTLNTGNAPIIKDPFSGSDIIGYLKYTYSGSDLQVVITDINSCRFLFDLPASNGSEYSPIKMGTPVLDGYQPESSCSSATNPVPGEISLFEVQPKANNTENFIYLGRFSEKLLTTLADEPHQKEINLTQIIFNDLLDNSQDFVVQIGNIYNTVEATPYPIYSPGVIPFGITTIGDTIESRGETPYSGYQDPTLWIEQNDWSKAEQVYDFLIDAQTAYIHPDRGDILGPLAPVYIWPGDDGNKYGLSNTWTWNGPDPNTFWGGFQARTFEAGARGHYLISKNLNAPLSLKNKSYLFSKQFLNWLTHYLESNNGSTPTEFYKDSPARSTYYDPGSSALYWRGALYLYLSSDDLKSESKLTISYMYNDIVNRSFNIALDNSKEFYGGLFDKNQISTPRSYSYWYAELIETLSLSYKFKDQLN